MYVDLDAISLDAERITQHSKTISCQRSLFEMSVSRNDSLLLVHSRSQLNLAGVLKNWLSSPYKT